MNRHTNEENLLQYAVIPFALYKHILQDYPFSTLLFRCWPKNNIFTNINPTQSYTYKQLTDLSFQAQLNTQLNMGHFKGSTNKLLNYVYRLSFVKSKSCYLQFS